MGLWGWIVGLFRGRKAATKRLDKVTGQVDAGVAKAKEIRRESEDALHRGEHELNMLADETNMARHGQCEMPGCKRPKFHSACH